MTETRWINRAIFLETIAGFPGMCGGMYRHLRSVRLLKGSPQAIKNYQFKEEAIFRDVILAIRANQALGMQSSD